MSESDEIKKILTDRITKADDFLEKTGKLVALVPFVQNQKEADITSAELINAFPVDYVEEIAGKWLALENENNRILSGVIPTLPELIKDTTEVLYSTAAGTISSYVSSGSNLVQQYITSAKEIPDWAKTVTDIMDQYSIKTKQREYIPERLEKINRRSGKIFKVALDTYNKCQNGIIGVDVSAIHFRAVLQQVWGGLVQLTTTRNKDPKINTNHLELKKVGDRELVANIIATPLFPKIKLISLLSNMYNLHYKLSDTKFGKDPLGKDFPLLKVYYSEWLSILDAISFIIL